MVNHHKISAVTEKEFEARHNHQVERPAKDVFLVWFALMFISVVAAHMLLNMTGGSPTGYVLASENPVENMSLLFNSMFILFFAIFVCALGYHGITRNDK